MSDVYTYVSKIRNKMSVQSLYLSDSLSLSIYIYIYILKERDKTERMHGQTFSVIMRNIRADNVNILCITKKSYAYIYTYIYSNKNQRKTIYERKTLD